MCLTLVLAAGGIAKYLHVSGARLRPEDAALFDVHINSDIPAEKLSAVGSYEANTEKQIVFVLSEDTNNEYGAREFWCVENQRFAAFFGLWVSDGATMWPLRDIRMQHDITVPFSAYAGALAVWSGNSDVERITLKMEDGNEHSADVNENGLCILTYDILDSGRVASGYAENERGERIYTLQKDSAAYDILRWEPVKKQDKS